MVAAVEQRGPEVHGRELREHAFFELDLQSLLDRRDEFTGHRSADGIVDELEALAALERLELDPHLGELPGTTGLFLVDVLLLDRLREGLAIGDLRLAHDALDVELAAHAIECHIEMQFTHAAQDGLTRLAVGLEAQRGIGTHHLAEGGAELLEFALDLGLHRDADDGLGEAHALEHHRMVGVAERVAGVGLGERDERDDVAGAGLLDRVGLLGEHLDHTTDLLALAARGVGDRHALGEHA